MLQPRKIDPEPAPSRAEEFVVLLGMFLDSASTLIGLKDLDGLYVFANRELELALGVEPGGLVGRSDGDLMPEAAAAQIARRELAVIRAGTPARAREELVTPSGPRACITVRFPYRGEDGQVVGSGVVAIDLPEARDAEPEAADALNSAEQTIKELKDAIEDLKSRSSSDRLTGVLNRARIEEAGRQEIRRLQRYAHPVSMLFLDIDHFKQVNDNHGHLTGDNVLREFCAVVEEVMRSTDLLGRWGGEEFLLLCPNTSLGAARVLAERIRASVAAHAFAGVPGITVSIGVAECVEQEPWDPWLARCDAALYRAKADGRNRVEVDAHRLSAADEKADASFVRLVWRAAYSSGHPLIDVQHRRLFESANSVIESVLGNRPADETKEALQSLFEDIQQHFHEEESLFWAVGFPDAEAHAKHHAALVDKALNLFRAQTAGQLGFGELVNFLAHEVVATHLLGEDRKFFPYLIGFEPGEPGL